MPDPMWLDAEEQRAWVGLFAGLTLMDAALDRQLQRDSGVTHARYGIMARLSQAPGGSMHMSELAANTSSSQSRISHAVAGLERDGLVTRTPCPRTKRAVHANLTPAGRALIESAAPGHVAEVRRLLFDHLSRDQVEQLGAITTTMIRVLGEEGFAIPALMRDDEEQA